MMCAVDAETARADEHDKRTAEADVRARETYAALAAMCGADLDAQGMTRETIAGVSYGVPALAAALRALAGRLSAIESHKAGG